MQIVPGECDHACDSAMRVARDKVEAAMLDHNPAEAMFAVMQMVSEVRFPAKRPSLLLRSFLLLQLINLALN